MLMLVIALVTFRYSFFIRGFKASLGFDSFFGCFLGAPNIFNLVYIHLFLISELVATGHSILYCDGFLNIVLPFKILLAIDFFARYVLLIRFLLT